MTESESTQFFQFDHQGNTYVFAPSAGCTGPTRLVRPGDELIFNSSYNQSDWGTGGTVKTKYKEGDLPQTCPATVSSTSHREFKEPLPDTELEDLGHKNFSTETMKQIRWVRKMYWDWRSFRHTHGLSHIVCDLENSDTITAESLKFALCHFITKVKKLNGDDFPGKTLYHIVVCIQLHLQCMGFAFKLINDPAFKDLKYTLDNTMKAWVSQGIGITVRQAEVLTATEEDLLWSMGCLVIDNLEQLLNTLIFCIGKGFALQAGKEHRALQGLPFAFYMQPWKRYFGKAWYVNRPAGINRLQTAVADMCKLAGLPGHYTNHSLRSTATTKLYHNSVDEQIIMEITGHRSMAIHSYKRTSDRQRKLASKCLFEALWALPGCTLCGTQLLLLHSLQTLINFYAIVHGHMVTVLSCIVVSCIVNTAKWPNEPLQL